MNPTDIARQALQRFATKTLPDAVQTAEHSWPNGESVVIEYADRRGRTWIAKRHLHEAAYRRETSALRDWAPRLGPGRAPTLVAADDETWVMITDRLPGTAGTADTPDAFRQAGRLTAVLHAIEPRGAEPDQSARLERKVDDWLIRAPGAFAADQLDLIRACTRQAAELPDPAIGSIHDDNQPRNWIVADDATLAMIDFGRAKIGVYLHDFERMIFAEWNDRPELADAFFDGYGRRLSDDEVAMINCRGAVQAMGTVIWSREHHSPDYEQHGWRILEQVRRNLAAAS